MSFVRFTSYLWAAGLILLFSLCLHAQDTRSIKLGSKQQYIETMSDFITLKLALTSDLETFSVYSGDIRYQINPNAATITTISINYSFISATFRFTPRFFPNNSDTDEKGKTKSLGFGLNLYLDHWLQELSYGRTKGYYLDNTSDFTPGWQEGDLYIQFPNLLYKGFQGTTGYKCNRNFSLNAISTQSERQLKSAGSFIPQIHYRYYLTDDRTRLETPNQSSQKARNLELLAGAGYYHNFIMKKNFNVALGLTPAAGFLFMNFTTRNANNSTINSRQRDLIVRVDARAGLGYNGERIFGGFYTSAFTSSYEQENSHVINGNSRIFFKLFLGYRISALSIVKEKQSNISSRITNKGAQTSITSGNANTTFSRKYNDKIINIKAMKKLPGQLFPLIPKISKQV
ncbi:DUF4421 family protein [Flavihumibacter sp. UBA7668]|uniref:DUF4421 family protein n=1 Tax=Flavihumibacter sp. UBA7668 TaxID=1946542 RepID=UPI0025C552FF|nr:DUF4421 family protein [Flavihumibacter sp. UBA7668]